MIRLRSSGSDEPDVETERKGTFCNDLVFEFDPTYSATKFFTFPSQNILMGSGRQSENSAAIFLVRKSRKVLLKTLG
jgi:hypothetical protein